LHNTWESQVALEKTQKELLGGIADELYHMRVRFSIWRASLAIIREGSNTEEMGNREEEAEEGEISEKGDNAEGSAKDNRAGGSQTMAE
jgi:hypothetical protein